MGGAWPVGSPRCRQALTDGPADQQPGQTVFTFIVDGFFTVVGYEPVSVPYFLIWITIAINWDACLLLLATCFVPWPQLVGVCTRAWLSIQG
jgi:hypothetical protein